MLISRPGHLSNEASHAQAQARRRSTLHYTPPHHTHLPPFTRASSDGPRLAIGPAPPRYKFLAPPRPPPCSAASLASVSLAAADAAQAAAVEETRTREGCGTWLVLGSGGRSAGTAGEEEEKSTAGSRSMGYARTVKAAAAAAAALLTAVGVRFLGPAAAAFVAEELPRARAVAATWLTPPYLYLVINAIIISIAASSRFQPSGGGGGGRPSAPSYAPAADADAIGGGGGVAGEEMVRDGIQPAVALQVPAVVPLVAVKAAEVAPVEEPVVEIHTVAVAPAPAPEDEVDEDFSISRSTWTPRRRGAEPEVAADVETEVPPFADLTNSREKPLVSARFSRKAAKPSPEGSRALRVARPRKEETLESTWKAITEGRGPPLARHLKKSDTWDTRPGRRPSGGGSSGEVDPAAVAPAGAAMRKAETFNDAGGAGRSKAAPPVPVRREPSLGQDELNRRVEAFIHKFNMEMRLQRQESLKHYNDMLGRGSRY
ncbi:uncharacterized protein LOC8081754 [Sorghum bicolor]|nr:uncharacterized protein LOC8081754 [Sorghum bicolor]|eukprot:XP_002463025.2 uncharacterized protein LOC8081754 [Sorghum bicolor]